MGKKEELEELNVFLTEETAGESDVDEVSALLSKLTTTTKVLSALVEVFEFELEDKIGATLIGEFRVRFAKHERKMLDEADDAP